MVNLEILLMLVTAPLAPMDWIDREKAFGKTVNGISVNDPYSRYFKYAAEEAFYKTAKSDLSLLTMNVSTDLLYQNKYYELQHNNIGNYESVKDSLAGGNGVSALQQLAVIVDRNLMEENKRRVISIIASGYDPSLDADSDTIMVLTNIAMMHPFYGGEAVYWARAILHLIVEDELPPLRRENSAQQFVRTTI